MTKRRVLWLAAGLFVLAAVVPLVPGSPVYLPDYFGWGGRYYDDHPTRYWVEALGSPDAQLRRRAAFALGALGSEAGEGVPALSRAMLEDADRGVRIEASLALSKMTPASRQAVGALARALADREPAVRMNAAITLSRLEQDSRPAIPALIAALKDDQNGRRVGLFGVTIRETVAMALGRASAGSADGVPALTDALEAADNDAVRKSVARALGVVGPKARPAIPRLREMLRHGDEEVRKAAEEALQSIQG